MMTEHMSSFWDYEPNDAEVIFICILYLIFCLICYLIGSKLVKIIRKIIDDYKGESI